MAFPDSFLNILDTTFLDFEFHRFPDAAAFLSRGGIEDGIEVVVFDASALKDSTAEAARATLGQFRGQARLAIAYRDQEMASELLLNCAAEGETGEFSLMPLNAHLEVMISVIRLILCGERYVPCDLLLKHSTAAAMPKAAAQRDKGGPSASLTEREWDVLSLVAAGMPNKMIAHRLDLSENTVKLHVHRMLGKVGASNRTEASNWYQTNAGPVEKVSVA